MAGGLKEGRKWEGLKEVWTGSQRGAWLNWEESKEAWAEDGGPIGLGLAEGAWPGLGVV